MEENETFTVGLAVSGTTHSVTATSTATGTITNDDTAPPATVTIADARADEGDAISFTVTLDRAVPGGLTVTPSFTDGTATKGTDYTENTTALTFAGTANETQTFSVSTTEDTEVEENETFTVGLTVSGTTHSVTATSIATGTITNDDTAPPATVTIADAKADEGDAISFTVTLDKAVPGGLTVTPSFTDGTATKGTDYTENTAALSFAGTANETQTFSVSTTEDTDVEENETFTVGLAVSGTTHSVTATSTATGTITNDDTAPPATVTIADARADEGDAISFTVTLDKAVPGGLTVTPLLHRRHRDQGHRLHREHGGPQLCRHCQRDADVQRIDDGGHGGRGKRDVHRRSDCFGHDPQRDRDLHRHRHHHQRRHRSSRNRSSRNRDHRRCQGGRRGRDFLHGHPRQDPSRAD